MFLTILISWMDIDSDRARVNQHVSRMMNAAQTEADRVQRAYPAAQMYFKIDDLDMALSFIDMYLTANHSDPSALYLKGVVLEKKGRLQEAILVYSNSLNLRPRQKELIIKVG